MGESKEYLGAFPKEDRIIFLIFLVLLAITPIIPWPDLPVTSATENSFAAVDNVPDGGAFMWTTDFTMSVWYEMEPPETAVFRHMMIRARDDGCKIVFVTVYEADGYFAQNKILAEQSKPEDYDLVWGEDYVQLGWLPGYESMLANLMQDLRTTAGGKDVRGNALDSLPMFAGGALKGAGDFHLLGYSTSTSPDPYVRQWGVGVGVNNVAVTLKDGTENAGAQLIGAMGTATVPWIMPYIDQGIQTSYISGQRGGAEYEAVLGIEGTGLGFMAGQTMGHFYAITLIIVTNIMYFMERRR
jgi:hypothetical protein